MMRIQPHQTPNQPYLNPNPQSTLLQGSLKDPVGYFRDTLKAISSADKTTIEGLTEYASKYYKYWKDLAKELMDRVTTVRINHLTTSIGLAKVAVYLPDGQYFEERAGLICQLLRGENSESVLRHLPQLPNHRREEGVNNAAKDVGVVLRQVQNQAHLHAAQPAGIRINQRP